VAANPLAGVVRPYAELRDAIGRRDRALRPKVTSLGEAAEMIADGENVGIGGSMMSRTPMAMLWALMRAGRKDLVCSRPIVTSEGDLLLGSGLSRHIITSWFSQGIMWGVSKVMRHYIENDLARFDEWSHLALGLRWRAGAMGVPFLPMRAMLGSDVLTARPDTYLMNCPFTGEEVLLVPALNPSVAIIHVHRCDEFGNAQIDGLPFMDPDLAMAADRVILTTEKLISNDEIRRAPDQTKIPFFCVDAVVEVPFGSAPHECYGLYEPVMEHLHSFTAAVNADPVQGRKKYLHRHVYSPSSWTDFLELIGLDKLNDSAQRAKALHDV
jgi:glutaconate CoA-transferase, subunit A